MAPGPLAQVLRRLPTVEDPNLLSRAIPFADAGVYRLRHDCALVQSVDFFTPVVDDPYVYGAVAAANSLSGPSGKRVRLFRPVTIAATDAGGLSATQVVRFTITGINSAAGRCCCCII